MSVTNPPPDSESLTDLPAFDLSYDVDDYEDPTEVTIYAGTASTRWIIIDVAHAVNLTDIA